MECKPKHEVRSLLQFGDLLVVVVVALEVVAAAVVVGSAPVVVEKVNRLNQSYW